MVSLSDSLHLIPVTNIGSTVHWDAEEEEETRPLNIGADVLGANDSDHLPFDEDQVAIPQ